MTTSEELTKLETAYAGWLDAGCPQSAMINGRSITTASAEWMSKRIDQLRAITQRDNPQSGGMFSVAQFRRPE